MILLQVLIVVDTRFERNRVRAQNVEGTFKGSIIEGSISDLGLSLRACVHEDVIKEMPSEKEGYLVVQGNFDIEMMLTSSHPAIRQIATELIGAASKFAQK